MEVAGVDDTLSLEEDLGAAEAITASDASAPEGDLDLDLDLDALAPELEEAAGLVEPAGQSKDDLDLADLDFDLEGEAPEKDLGGEEPELSLADEPDLALEEPEPSLDASTPKTVQEDADQGFDLEIDLGDDLDLEMGAGAKIADKQTEEPELVLAPESDKAGEPAGEGLDLSDLDSLLDTADEDLGGKADGSEDLELELDLEDIKEPKASAQAPAEDDLEDLEFELDTEFSDGTTAEAAPAVETEEMIEEDDEIDLSDIEQMLEGDEAQHKAPKPVEAFETDIDLDLGGDSGEIDLAEIESAIDSADSITASKGLDEEVEDQDLELDLDLSDQPSKAEASDDLELDLSVEEEAPAKDDLELDLDLEFDSAEASAAAQPTEEADDELDLSDLSELVVEPKKKSETIDSGDIELEFEIEDSPPAPVSAPKDVTQTAGRVPEIPIEETLEAPFFEDKPAKAPKPVKPKKKTSKTLLVLFVLILLGGIGYGAYYAVTQLGIEIPYLSDYLKPKPQDSAGTLNLSTLEINSKFIENSLSGRLFVITGKVRNGYSANREKIRLQGKLFTKGKVMVKTEYSYAGIMLNDQELATLPIAQIKQRLTAVPQVQASDTIVRPGQNIPFMVVFSELPPPEQLDEFAIELLSSVQGR